MSKVILKGIAANAMGGFLCIRGYARAKELSRISIADTVNYQRDLFSQNAERIISFLNDREYLFFPEVILSYTINMQYTDNNTGIDPFQEMQSRGGFLSNLDSTRIKINSETLSDARRDDIVLSNIATIEVDDSEPILKRIDGNHRLTAVDNNETLGSIIMPYCIIIFPQDDNSLKKEMTIFHNVNGRAIPLKKEELLKGILDRGDLFPDAELLRIQSYGEDYVNTRYLRNKIINANYSVLNNLANFENKREFCMSIFGLINEMEKKEEIISKLRSTEDYSDYIFDKLVSMAGYLQQNDGILETNNSCIVCAMLYFYLFDEKQFLLFFKWLKRNCLLNIEDVSAIDLVKVFTSIYENRNRKIFVSLDTREGNDNYNSIKHAVEKISDDYNLQLELDRVDTYRDGTSFNIPDTIQSMIQDCGLHIVDLTGNNLNVYNEAGYRLGVNDTENHGMLYILKLHGVQRVEDTIGSNIKMENIKCFRTLEELENILKQELEQRFVNMTTGLE